MYITCSFTSLNSSVSYIIMKKTATDISDIHNLFSHDQITTKTKNCTLLVFCLWNRCEKSDEVEGPLLAGYKCLHFY